LPAIIKHATVFMPNNSLTEQVNELHAELERRDKSLRANKLSPNL